MRFLIQCCVLMVLFYLHCSLIFCVCFEPLQLLNVALYFEQTINVLFGAQHTLSAKL